MTAGDEINVHEGGVAEVGDRDLGTGTAGDEISVHEGGVAEVGERADCLVVHPELSPSLHPRLWGRRCRGPSVGALEVNDCSVVGIAGLEPRRDLPSGLVDKVVKLQKSESEDDDLDEEVQESKHGQPMDSEVPEQAVPVAKKTLSASLATKETERQLSKKELKKKNSQI